MIRALTVMLAASLVFGCARVERRDFGVTRSGERASCWKLDGRGGLTLEVTDYGCAVVGVTIPGDDGGRVEIAADFDSAEELDGAPAFFGVIVGRYANRIAYGRFTVDGVEYQLELNDAAHNAVCHSGSGGWHSVVWDAEPFTSGDDVGIVFTHVFPDGECGFPGEVKAKVVYTVSVGNVWRIDYEAETSRRTPMSPTSHVYWNLDGGGVIDDHVLGIDADRYLQVDANLIPLRPKDVGGTDFDFRVPRRIGFDSAYDHNWCLNGMGFRKVAEVAGRYARMEVWTDQPGLQFYSGLTINPAYRMSRSRPIRKNGFLALETQRWPDSPNRPDFPNAMLAPGEIYRSTTEYRFYLKGL